MQAVGCENVRRLGNAAKRVWSSWKQARVRNKKSNGEMQRESDEGGKNGESAEMVDSVPSGRLGAEQTGDDLSKTKGPGTVGHCV